MWRDEAYLLDMLTAARHARDFCEKLTREQFQESKLHHYAVMRALEVIGEAARKISGQFQEAHPEIPWKEMISMRNRLIHEYFHIDVGKVWDTLQNDIPPLIRLIEPLIPPEEQ